MTNRRFAVTSLSAAFSSPACARLASRRSSSASVMRGSFWMSWRYWSNAVEGDERKKPLDLLSVEVCIHAPVGLFSASASIWLASHLYRAHDNDRESRGQQPRFVPKRNVMLTVFFRVFLLRLRRGRRIFGLRSAGSGQNADADHHDDPDDEPRRRHAEEKRGDCQSDD